MFLEQLEKTRYRRGKISLLHRRK